MNGVTVACVGVCIGSIGNGLLVFLVVVMEIGVIILVLTVNI